MNKSLENIAIELGYVKKDFGFFKQGKEYCHWITIFSNDECQFYSYYNDDIETEGYNTGVLTYITPKEFIVFAKILFISHD